MTRITPWWIWALLTVLLASGTALGQVTTGTPPLGSFSGGPFDTINNANLNVHFSIPILNKTGRGLPFNYALTYDSAVWYPTGVTNNMTWVPVTAWGWNGISDASTGWIFYHPIVKSCTYGGEPQYWVDEVNWTYYDPSGTSHPFSGAVSTFSMINPPCGSDTLGTTIPTESSTDGSGYFISINLNASPTATVYTASGMTINAPVESQTGAGSVTPKLCTD